LNWLGYATREDHYREDTVLAIGIHKNLMSEDCNILESSRIELASEEKRAMLQIVRELQLLYVSV